MAIDTYASGDDRVQIRTGDNTLTTCTSYDVKTGIIDQPSTFSLRIGDGSLAAKLLKTYPANTAFQLLIGGAPQFSGYTEGRSSSGSANQGSELDIQGRSILAKLLSDLEKEASFNAKTHRELVEQALSDLDIIKPFSNGKRPDVLSSNGSARRQRSNLATIKAYDADDWTDILMQPAGNEGDGYQVLRTKLAEKYFDLLRKHLDTVGLLLWDSPAGDIVVGRPNWRQAPSARLIRQLGRVATSNIEGHHFREDYSQRLSEVAIYGRTHGRKYNKYTVSGAFTDDEMVNLGIHRVKVLRDVNVTSIAHAEAIAKKHLAASRRAAFTLEYQVRGHSTDSTHGGSLIWTPDIVVDVVDEELGLSDKYYVEGCRYTRDAHGTHTTLKLLEVQTLIFGDDNGPPNGISSSSSTSTTTPGQKTYFVAADFTVTDLSLILYADTNHTADLLSLNPTVFEFNRVRDAYVAPADSTIVYVPAK